MIIVENLSYRIRQHERAQVEKLAKQQYDNHLFSLRRIDNVNRKHHDLRHIIRGIEALDSIEEIKSSIKSIENEIQNYELIFNTGNKTLDINFSDRMQEAKEKISTCTSMPMVRVGRSSAILTLLPSSAMPSIMP